MTSTASIFNALALSWEHAHIGVAILHLNRPLKGNAASDEMLDELPRAMRLCEEHHPEIHAIVLAGHGKNFCAGLDFETLTTVGKSLSTAACPARARDALRRRIQKMQAAVTALERCKWPVIAAIHGACVGAGVDIVTACDVRVCTCDSRFCVKEVDLAITADMGTLQRLPLLVGEGRARELALTARTFSGADAVHYGLATSCVASASECYNKALEIAKGIAAKPAMAVMGTKAVMLYNHSRSVHAGLEYVALWNSGLLMSRDLEETLNTLSASRTRSSQSKL